MELNHWGGKVMRHKQLVFLTTAAVLCVGLVTAALAGGRPMPPGSAGDNIALNKPYTMSPAPNYSYCTDAGDATQLTDGIYTSGYFWTQQSTVGWLNPSSAPTIIIDLGQVQPIQQISYNTAGGGADVYWPTAINLSISNDGINYYSAGDLASLSNTQHNNAPSYGTYSLHCYDASLQTRGRYVKFEVIRQGNAVFVDEIKIYRGANSLLGTNIALNKPYTMSPAPNYPYCTDAGDATQLTDGAYTSGWFWTQQSTVGWSNPPSAPTIIIDLGSIQPVKGVSYNTAGGVGGAYWPTAINLFVSNDGINYSSIGDLASISNSEHGNAPAYGTHAVHRYWTDQLATFGRYVKLEVIQQPFVFVDEIMIYKN